MKKAKCFKKLASNSNNKAFVNVFPGSKEFLNDLYSHENSSAPSCGEDADPCTIDPKPSQRGIKSYGAMFEDLASADATGLLSTHLLLLRDDCRLSICLFWLSSSFFCGLGQDILNLLATCHEALAVCADNAEGKACQQAWNLSLDTWKRAASVDAEKLRCTETTGLWLDTVISAFAANAELIIRILLSQWLAAHTLRL